MWEFGQGLNIIKKKVMFSLFPFTQAIWLRDLMVRALDSHLGKPGSIPGIGLDFILFLSLRIDLVSKKLDFKWVLILFSLNVQRL